MEKASIFAPEFKSNREFFKRSESSLKDGLVVQLVRIHACHAWGRGFESRPDRKRRYFRISFCFLVLNQRLDKRSYSIKNHL